MFLVYFIQIISLRKNTFYNHVSKDLSFFFLGGGGGWGVLIAFVSHFVSVVYTDHLVSGDKPTLQIEMLIFLAELYHFS